MVSKSIEASIIIPPNGSVDITYLDGDKTVSYTCSTLEGCEIFAYSTVYIYNGSLVLPDNERIFFYGKEIVNNTGDTLTVSVDGFTASLTGEQSLTVGDHIYTNGSISIDRQKMYLSANETVTIKRLSDGAKEIVFTAGANGCTFDPYISTDDNVNYFIIYNGSFKIGNIEIQGAFYLFEDCIRIDSYPVTINRINMKCEYGMARIEVDENSNFTILENAVSVMLYEGSNFVVGNETLPEHSKGLSYQVNVDGTYFDNSRTVYYYDEDPCYHYDRNCLTLSYYWKQITENEAKLHKKAPPPCTQCN